MSKNWKMAKFVNINGKYIPFTNEQDLIKIQDKEIERLNNIIGELEKICETRLSIFEQMTDEQREEQLDKYKLYDTFLSKIQELKGEEGGKK